MSTATIDPEKIRKELSDLWVSLGKESAGEPGKESAPSAGVLRACSMTLIAAADEADDPAEFGETIAMLMREHPSRAIAVRVRRSPEPFLSSRVLAQCWMPFGDRRQICCEQVEITASTASLMDVPAVVMPLAVADLPVILWCRGDVGLEALSSIAGKVIVDSAVLPGLQSVASLAALHRVADFAWIRLTRWREAIAQIFENKSNLAELPALTRVRLTYTEETPPPSWFYLAAWLDRPSVAWERGARRAVSLESGDGQVRFAIRATPEESCVEVEVRGKIEHAVFPKPTDYTMLREELSIPGRDSVFESVLPHAAALAAEFHNGGSRA